MSMVAAGGRRRHIAGRILAIIIICGAVAAGLYMYQQDRRFPSSDDAAIDADVVHVASAVGGQIIDLPVTENAAVRKGDILFRIDPAPYRYAVAQATAELAAAQGLLAMRQRSIKVEIATANLAHDQVTRAQANYALAVRTVVRLQPLAAKSYIPVQQLDQAEVAENDAATSLAQAVQQETATQQAIGDVNVETATVQARQAALSIAQYNLNQTVVRALHDGRVTGLTVLTGEFVAPTQSLFTLIGTDEWFVSANIREGDLNTIHIGGCVTAYSMIDRSQPIEGRVISMGSGVLDDSQVDLPKALPYVQRSVNWVRVAQRFPVRILLEKPPETLMRVGASADVEFGYGPGCR